MAKKQVPRQLLFSKRWKTEWWHLYFHRGVRERKANTLLTLFLLGVFSMFLLWFCCPILLLYHCQRSVILRMKSSDFYVIRGYVRDAHSHFLNTFSKLKEPISEGQYLGLFTLRQVIYVLSNKLHQTSYHMQFKSYLLSIYIFNDGFCWKILHVESSLRKSALETRLLLLFQIRNVHI